MYSHFTLYPFTFFIVLQYLLFNLPFSFGADDFRYTNCSQPFNCGNITNIPFPFWGYNRPEYCGQPGFEVRCEDDDRIELVTGTQRYRVLNFSNVEQRLHIVPVDTSTDSCPAPPVNVSIHSPYYIPRTQNVTLFYDCPETPLLANRTYPCSLNDTPTRNYVWTDAMAAVLPYAEVWAAQVWRCRLIVRVPIIPRLAGIVVSRPSSSLEVLKEGFIVGYTIHAAFCRNCRDSDGHCGYNWTTNQTMCYCYDNQYQGRCPNLRPVARGNVQRKIVIGVSAGVGCVVLTTLLFALWNWYHSSSNSIILWERQNKTHRLVEDFLRNDRALFPKRYNYDDLKKITSSFTDKIGQGGYGEVYKGKLLDGRLVAVKLLNEAKGAGGQEFINEVASISKTSHVNVVSLLGFCFDTSKRALIYEFMVNGSLEKFIYDRPLEAQPHLRWNMLYKIVVGVARGLEYLHRGCTTRILHFDIKPHNILLDLDFTPKISDFGLAKLCPRNESIISMVGARGTAGYIAPEVSNRQFGGVSHKSDVYSYGMMVLEIVGKRKNIDINVNHTSEIYFPNWIHKRLELNEDLGLNGIMSAEEGDRAKKMALVALWCIQINPKDRPTMTRVVEMLESTHELLSIPPNPYLGSPPRSPRSPVSFATA